MLFKNGSVGRPLPMGKSAIALLKLPLRISIAAQKTEIEVNYQTIASPKTWSAGVQSICQSGRTPVEFSRPHAILQGASLAPCPSKVRKTAMSINLRVLLACSVALLMAAFGAKLQAAPIEGTVLYADRMVKIPLTLAGEADLWVTPEQITAINGYTLKPEGLCREEICIPISRKPADGFVQTKDGAELFNMSKLADKLSQPIVRDVKRYIWS